MATAPTPLAEPTGSRVVRGVRDLVVSAVLVAVLAAVVAGIVVALSGAGPVWRGESVLVVKGNATAAYRAAQTYALVLEEDPGLRDAIATATGDDARAVADGLSVQAVQDTALLRVTFEAPSAAEVSSALNAVSAYTNDPDNLQILQDSPVSTLANDDAPSETGVALWVVVLAAAVAGAVVGLFLGLAYRAVRPTARDASTVERVTGVSALMLGNSATEVAVAVQAAASTHHTDGHGTRVCVITDAATPNHATNLLRGGVDHLGIRARVTDTVSPPDEAWTPGGSALEIVVVGSAGDVVAAAISADVVVLLLYRGAELTPVRELVRGLAVLGQSTHLALVVPAQVSADAPAARLAGDEALARHSQ